MSRPAKEFTQQQIDTARQLQSDGTPRSEIAETLNITASAYAWYLKTGRFGFDLPKSQGRGRKPPREDDESTGQILGCSHSDWVSRKEEIRDSWPPSVEIDRREGRMPNRKNNFSLFEQGHELDNKQSRDHRQSPRNW